MSGKKARLSSLARQLEAVPSDKAAVSSRPRPLERSRAIEPNPTRGERGDFLRVTITLPAELLGALREVGLRRRANGQRDTSVSALVREAAAKLVTEAN